MKKIRIFLAAAAMVALSSAAYAAGTATLDISATVQGTCSFQTSDTLDFGSLDPTVAVDQSLNSVGVTFICTNGTTFNVTDDGGLLGTYTLDSGTDTIPYALTYNGGSETGTGTGVAQNLDVTIGILGTDYATASAGTYADTVTFSILP